MQHRAVDRDLVLVLHELTGGRRHLRRDLTELLVERVHGARSRVGLVIQVLDLVRQRVDIAAELRETLLELGALAANLVELGLIRSQTLLGRLGRALLRHEAVTDNAYQEHDDGSAPAGARPEGPMHSAATRSEDCFARSSGS